MTKKNKKAGWVEDVTFIFEECARIQALIAATPPGEYRNLPRSEVTGDLPHPSGRGTLICGAEAARRIHRLADEALSHSDAAGTIESIEVRKALRRTLVDRFLKDRLPIDEPSVEKAMGTAVKFAKRARQNTVHYFPCRLMLVAKPESFSIGPVTFMTTDEFNRRMANKFDGYVRGDGSKKDTKLEELLSADARHYYDGFTWIAEVKVLGCDAKTSKMRGKLAVTAALNFIHVIFGAYYTDRMAVGGPRMADDNRAHIVMDEKGVIDISCSRSPTSAVGFHEGWEKLFEKETAPLMISSAGKALETLTNPVVKHTMRSRITDSVGWFGDAVREQSPAAKIVKALTALEALVMTGERDDITSILSERAAAMCFDPERDKSFDDVRQRLRDAYDARSSLSHGSLSPFDPEVTARAPECLYWAERAIGGALVLFESHGLFDRLLTQKQLAIGLSRLIDAAKGLSAEREAAAPS